MRLLHSDLPPPTITSAPRRQPRTPLTSSLTPLLAALTLAATPANAANDVTGVWYDDSGKGAVELYRCAGNLCGRIYWLRQPLAKSGRPLRDAYNPSPERRNQPICGLQVISGVSPQPDGGWDGGTIYDPKVGKSYNVAIDRVSTNQLEITGYLSIRLFGKSFNWRRAPASLPRCQNPSQ